MVKFLKFCFSSLLFSTSLGSLRTEWNAWKSLHKIEYETVEEDYRRLEIFSKNKDFIQNHNVRFALGQETYTVKMNKFGATTTEEFNKIYFPNVRSIKEDPVLSKEFVCDSFTSNGSAAPDQLSYVKGDPNTDPSKVYVTMVKDQGQCGSCWTFGAAASMEALMCRSGLKDCNSWTGLSTQQIVDCASWTGYTSSFDDLVIDLTPYDNHGCNGGLESNAVRYGFTNGGMNNWDDYGYVSGSSGKKQPCAYNVNTAITGQVNSCKTVANSNEALLKNAVNEVGPMSVAIDASGNGFRYYDGGVYSSKSCSNVYLNHAVTLTGYGVDSGIDYWQIKNSWGEDWGVNGFIMIQRNNGNMCGVAADVTMSF